MLSAVWEREHVGEIGSDEGGTVYNLYKATRAGVMEKVSFEPVLKIREGDPWISWESGSGSRGSGQCQGPSRCLLPPLRDRREASWAGAE